MGRLARGDGREQHRVLTGRRRRAGRGPAARGPRCCAVPPRRARCPGAAPPSNRATPTVPARPRTPASPPRAARTGVRRGCRGSLAAARDPRPGRGLRERGVEIREQLALGRDRRQQQLGTRRLDGVGRPVRREPRGQPAGAAHDREPGTEQEPAPRRLRRPSGDGSDGAALTPRSLPTAPIRPFRAAPLPHPPLPPWIGRSRTTNPRGKRMPERPGPSFPLESAARERPTQGGSACRSGLGPSFPSRWSLPSGHLEGEAENRGSLGAGPRSCPNPRFSPLDRPLANDQPGGEAAYRRRTEPVPQRADDPAVRSRYARPRPVAAIRCDGERRRPRSTTAARTGTKRYGEVDSDAARTRPPLRRLPRPSDGPARAGRRRDAATTSRRSPSPRPASAASSG